ncbi:MAG: transporter substrate-binding domain-containing protein [Gordonibacter sp.]|nr:transporter substrate-binding domain-containing protein [Gordonibacter sp.]
MAGYARRAKRVLSCTVVAFAVAMALVIAPAYADEEPQRVVRVAFPQQNDLTEVESDGSYHGYTYDYLEKIAQITGWKIEYVHISEPTLDESLIKTLEMLKAGEVDLVGGLSKTNQLEQVFEYTQNSYGIMYSVISAREDNLSLTGSNFSMMQPLRVGVWGTVQKSKEKLEVLLEAHNVNYEFHEYRSYDQMMVAFETGEVDVIPDVSIGSIKGSKQLITYASELFYFAAPKGDVGLVEELDAAIDSLNFAFPFFQSDLAEKYLNKTQGNFFITEEETSYIERKKVIRVLCVPDSAPFVFQDENGKWTGIAVSVMEEFATRSGLEIEFEPFDRTKDFSKVFRDDGYDCILGIPVNAAYNEKIGVITSTPYLSMQQVYFTKHGDTQKPFEESRVAALRGSDLSTTLDCKEVVYYDTTEACINAVMSGEVDGGYGNQYCVDYYTQHNFVSLAIVPMVGDTRNMEISVNKEEDVAFLSLLNRYLDHLGSEQIYSFHAEANAVHTRNWFVVLMYSDPLKFAALVTGVVLLVCLAVASFFFARSSRKKNRQLQTAIDAKSDFLSRVSHDMRTPMNAILSFSSMNLDEKTSSEQLSADMRQINRSGQYLLGLINDILDMSKVENKKMDLEVQPLYLSACIEDIEASIRPLMDERRLQFDLKLEIEDREPAVLCDALRTKQIFINLLSNAAKFTPEGGCVSFLVKSTKRTEHHLGFHFSVVDSGIGMSEEFQRHLFEPFSQEQREVANQLAGMGLGLSIVKQLVDLMGGILYVVSVQGSGSRFDIELTYKLASYDDQAQSPPRSLHENNDEVLQGKRVLLCEDHPVNAEIARRLLQKKGMDVEYAPNGQIAVQLFSTAPSGYFDVVLMDVKMPVMDGIEAVKAIRALSSRYAQDIPIIAVTANAFERDIEETRRAGMNEHLSKPLDQERLYRVLVGFLRGGDLA